MPLPKLFLAFCKGIFIYVLLFQQIIIREVIDFHGLAHFGEGGGGGLFGHGAAFLQNFHDLGQALLPLLAAVADGLQLSLHDAVQELLHLHVAQTAALIVCLQLVEVLVLGQELGKVLRAAECIQIDEDGVALHLAGSCTRRWFGSVYMDMIFFLMSSGSSER